MDKNAIKKYAVWARTELIARVTQKALQYGIEKDKIVDAAADSVHGKVLSATEKKQRQALIAQIHVKGFEQVMEEVAYTWFNRFSALRFMEVNGYLPSHVRVFTDEENKFKPQIITEAIHLELDGLDMEKVYAYKEADKTEELFKYLLIVQCNALNDILPGMFQKIEDYTELLLPDNLLREGSVVEQLITTIPEEDWKDAVQIIGWLYQFYNIEPKAKVFSKKGAVKKEEIPAATQLFTPDWIVRYMVENSLGRLWIDHVNGVGSGFEFPISFPVSSEIADPAVEALKAKWQYYVEDVKQEADVERMLSRISESSKNMNPEDIRCIDPCMGSGHVLAYMFDVLMQIYESYGYTVREAVSCIVSKNLWGLDIDDRAAQLANFAVMMKARQYDRRFFSHCVQPHVYSICESNNLDKACIDYFVNDDAELKKHIDLLISEMHDAKEYGSLVEVTSVDFERIYSRFEEVHDEISIYTLPAMAELLPFVDTCYALAQKYNVVVTNPPYMPVGNTSAKLNDFIKKNYPDSKTDLYSVFIERCNKMVERNGYQAMITMHSWMFLTSFEKLREKMSHYDMVNMVHLGARAFEEIGGEVVQTTSFIIQKCCCSGRKGTYCRLTEPTTQQGKEDLFLTKTNRFVAKQSNFQKIPGTPMAYWVSQAGVKNYDRIATFGTCATTKQGFKTGNNDLFLRLWYEIETPKFSMFVEDGEVKWHPCNKGGTYRKWFGNQEYVVNWEDDGYAIRNYRDENGKLLSRPQNLDYNFKEGLTWSSISSGPLSLRYSGENMMFESKGSGCFVKPGYDLYCAQAFLNSVVGMYYIQALAPTLDYSEGSLLKLPYDITANSTISDIAKKNIEICKADWDSFENSWDFWKHPLVPTPCEWEEQRNSQFAGTRVTKFSLLSWHYAQWEYVCNYRFDSLKENEEELNRIFIDIYGLQDELDAVVDDKDVSVHHADLQREIKSLISYAVGCMFGRYSLDTPGLVYAGGEWDTSKYVTFPADKDSIIPICDDEYFEDDIVGRFIKFIEVVYGKDTLNENLKFIADALGGKGNPMDVIRNYFLNDFYNDHLKIYQKRPIYWQFDSGKKNGFKCLIYMHRYQPDTIARIRTDYVHEQQARYRTAIVDLEQRISNASAGERVKLSKKLKTLQEQAAEIHGYEEKIHHLADQMIRIDLDDGVKKNYEIFKDVLAKIK